MLSDSRTTLTIPLAEIRSHLRIKLAVTPRHIFKALWEPHGRMKDNYREELVAILTEGWEVYTIIRPAAEYDAARLLYNAAPAQEVDN